MDNYFCFAGRRCTDFDIFVERFPTQEKPARQVELISVPGRNGALRIDKGGYENVTISYECYCRGGPAKISEISGWLYSCGSGYAELRDTYHPGGFRLAAFDGPLSAENFWNRHGRFTVQFDCKPQIWADAGQIPIEYTIPAAPYDYFDAREMGKLYNPYPFAAAPLILLSGSADVTLTISNALGSRTLLCTTSYYTTIDCEMHNMSGAYHKGDIEGNLNSQLNINTDFPVLAPGENTITLARKAAAISPTDAPAAGLQIIPRWWYL